MVHLARILAIIAGLIAVPAYAQQNIGLIASDRLLGRDTASVGQLEQLTVGGALSFTGSGGITATGANILTQLLTVDGSGSTLDADLLDGITSADFLTEAEAVLAGDVDGAYNSNDLDEAAVESELESVLDKNDLQGALTLTGDVDGDHSSNDLDEVSVESELESVIDLADLQGSLTLAGDVDGAHGSNDLDEVAVENELESVLDAADLQGDITLTTDTAGDYVAAVADGTGVDGTATGEGSTYTPSLDLTELNTFTLGAGAATGIIFNAGVTDPAIETASGSFTIDIGGTNEVVVDATDTNFGTNVLSTGTVDAANDLDAADDVLIGDDVNFGAGDVLISYAANDLDFSGVTGDYSFDDTVLVTGTVDASDDLDAGDDVLIADDISFGGGDVLISYAANDLEFSGVTGDYGFDDDVIVVGKVDASTDVDAAGDLIAGDDLLMTDDINFGGGDVLISYAANDLDFSGVTGDYSFDDTVLVTGTVDASDDLDAGDDVLIADDISFGGGDVLIEYSANDLGFSGVTGDYSFDDTVGVTGSVTASVDVTATAGDVTSGDDVIAGDDVLLSNAGVVNFGSGDCTLTEGTDTLTIAGTCTLVTELVTPDGDNTRDLGSTAAAWQDLYIITIELGADTDTTLTRSAAGVLAVEGNDVLEDVANAIDQANLADDAVGEPELDFIDGDTHTDENCVTYESGGANGTFETQSCGAGSGDELGTDKDAGDITISGGSGLVADIDPAITIDSTADAVDGIIWTFEHSDPTPDAGDDPFEIVVNAGDDQETVALLRVELVDDATTTEDVYWAFTTDLAGTDTQAMLVAGGGVVIGAGTTLPGAGNVAFADGLGIDNAEGTPMFGFQNDAGGGIIDFYDDMIPDTDAAYDLGTASLGIRDIFITSDLELGGGTATTITEGTAAGMATVEGKPIVTVVGVQVFTTGTAATYTPTTGTKFVKVTCTGGGGGGGGADNSNATDSAAAGGGGQAGGTAIAWMDLTELGANAVYTIGAAGGGGDDAGSNGTDGGTTTFDAAGTHATLSGGGGDGGDGAIGSSTATDGETGGGSDGVASGGDITIEGGSGASGYAGGDVADDSMGGAAGGLGGSSYWGGGGLGTDVGGGTGGAAGSVGKAHGSGGGGAGVVRSTTGFAGGDGIVGICEIVEYGS